MEKKQNIKLAIAYDGTGFLGWQKTFTGKSIEEELQNALEQILQEKIVLQAASRTDAGVHAQGQIVNFLTTKENLSLDKLMFGVNSLLPKSIVVKVAEKMPLDFHPTLHCTAKEYHYSICNYAYQLPMHRQFSWHCPFPLNIDQMEHAAKCLVGTHDYSTFCNFKKNSKTADFVRTITEIKIMPLPENRIRITVLGNSFLYKMVRNIVGLLVNVGEGKISLDSVPLILKSRDRTQAGVTAPAHGLSLHCIYY